MAFNPDEYLSRSAPDQGFDPDAYLKDTEEKSVGGFAKNLGQDVVDTAKGIFESDFTAAAKDLATWLLQQAK